MFITVVRGDELISIQAAPDSYVQEILLKARQELCPYEHSIRVREVFHCDGRPLEARKPNFNSPVSPPILGLKAACRNYEREVVEQGPDLELELSVVGISGGVADAELFMGAKTTTRLGQVASFVANQLAPGQQGVHQVKLYLGDHGVRSLRFSKTASGVRFDVEASCEDSPLADFLCYHEPIPVWHKYLGTEAEVISGIKISDCQSIRGDFILQYEATEDGSRGAGFLNVSNATVDRKWSSSAPAWRIACNGLAVEGKCFNQNCKAHNSNVIHKWGLKSFDLLKDAESVRCPMCATNIRPNNFGFSNCSYKIVAASPSFNPTVYTKSWTTVGDCYRTYSDTSEEITYERLQVHVRQPSRTLTPSGTSPAQDSTVGMAIPPPDDCAICMEPLRNRLQTTSCGHSFHSTCINKFASYCARDGRACLCPLCRAEFRTR